MQQSARAPFVPDSLRLSSKEAELMGVLSRETVIVTPNGGQNGYSSSNNQIDFNAVMEGEGINLLNSYLRFKVDFFQDSTFSAVDPSGGSFVSAEDVFEHVEFFYANKPLINQTSRRVRNLYKIIQKNELNKTFYEYPAKNLLGHNSYGLNLPPGHTDASGSTPWSGSRYYTVPLWMLHPGLAIENLPMLGNTVTLKLRLAPESQCLATRGNANSAYRVSDVELVYDRIVYQDAYRTALVQQTMSEEGFGIPMIDSDVQALNPTGTDVNYTQQNIRTNALSLYIYDAVRNAGRADTVASSYPTRSDPTLDVTVGSLTDRLRVFSGRRIFTKQHDGITTKPELIVALEMCASGLGRESSSGTITWEEYHGLNSVGPTFSPLGVSLERTSMSDTDMTVVNRGISGFDKDVSSDINVQLSLSAQIDTAKRELYSALVYEKTVMLKNGEVIVVE